jgi:hypothetical protein
MAFQSGVIGGSSVEVVGSAYLTDLWLMECEFVRSVRGNAWRWRWGRRLCSRLPCISDIEEPGGHGDEVSRRDAPEVLQIVSPINQRAQGMPGARCTRGLACKMHKRKRTRAYRFSGGNPAFPAQWFYGLCRALPGDEFVLVTVIDGYGFVNPVGLEKPPPT